MECGIGAHLSHSLRHVVRIQAVDLIGAVRRVVAGPAGRHQATRSAARPSTATDMRCVDLSTLMTMSARAAEAQVSGNMDERRGNKRGRTGKRDRMIGYQH